MYSLITFGVSQDRANPSPLDPPDHLFRVRLCCTLLDTCGQYFSGGTSKKKLDCFFVYFQRYYWFKRSDPNWSEESNPFPLGVEFLFRDTVTTLRPRLQLCANLEEAEAAVTTLQEELMAMLPPVQSPNSQAMSGGLAPIEETTQEEEEEAEGGDSLSPDTRPLTARGHLGLHTIAENEEDGEENLSDMEADNSELQDLALTHTYENYSQSQGDEMLTGDDEVEGEFPDAADEDLQAPRTRPRDCQEDLDFMAAFDKMVSDNIQDRMKESVKLPHHDIVVPVNVKGSSAKKVYEQLLEPEETVTTVNFVLITRKGNKQQLKNLVVPITSELALNQKNREEAERAEKERVKKLTLDINERLEEEDYQEMLAQPQRPTTVNLNRERRPKYQHPKGAPDADLIFGSKKV
ncbi:hypothetical protein B566_EDAN000757 [Ephemera danica]|nr:hypothetical protein B566_EDAN000757 [Ephemera danica]